MKIFDQTKQQEILNPDLDFGYLTDDKLQIGMTLEVIAKEEVGHYEVIKEIHNSDGTIRGIERQWVVDVPSISYQPSEPIYEDIKVYILYSKEQMQEIKENEFYLQYKNIYDEMYAAHDYLNITDYKAIQFAEGVLSALEFEAIRQQRITTRNTVRRLQKYLADERLKFGLLK